jgi:hypothetical protein
VTSRMSHLKASVLAGGLAVLGTLVLLLAAARPSVGRLIAGGLLLGAAAVVRYQDQRRDDPTRYGRSAQVRSIVWSAVIVVVVIGVSVALAHPWSD